MERTWHANAKAERQDCKQQEVHLFKRKLRLSSDSTASVNSQTRRVTYLFLDYDLPLINSTTAQNNMVDTCTVLAAYAAARKLQSGVVLLRL